MIAHIPVIMLTARADDLDRIRGGIEGAIRYLTKPFSPSELRNEVSDALTGDPEPMKRRKAQTEALEKLARIESGTPESPGGSTAARPHLTRLERAPEPETAALDSERGRELQEALLTLSETDRSLLLLTSQEKLSYREVGEILGISVAAVKVRVFRARQRLAKSLEK